MRAEHADKYARKWFADDNTGEPTDEALRDAFARCGRPARPDEYDAIREAIWRMYTWAERLATMPTLSQGQTADLKYDDRAVRVWLHRTGIADGEDYERPVSIELLQGGRWEHWDTVDGDDPYTNHVFISVDVREALRESGAPV